MKKIHHFVFVVMVLFSSLFARHVYADTASTTLNVDSIAAVKTSATPDGTFVNGWKWDFAVTVPADETFVSMKFTDWTIEGSTSTIPAGSNIRFYSEQSSNASSTDSAIVITGAGTYSAPMYIVGDTSTSTLGNQIIISVEVSVPAGTNGGAYSSSYGIQSNSTGELSIVGLIANDKVYDGNVDATATGTAMLVGAQAGDDVTLTGTSTLAFDTKDVGSAKPVTMSGYVLSGADAGKYTLVQPVLSANITQMPITADVVSLNKTYDGNTNVASSTTCSVDTVILPGDFVSCSVDSALFNDFHVGTASTVTYAIHLTAADKDNYSLTNLTGTTTGAITPEPIVSFDSISDLDGGSITASTTVALSAIPFPMTVTANNGEISVPVVSWTDVSSTPYDQLVSGTYTFNAVLGVIPSDFANPSTLTATINVLINP